MLQRYKAVNEKIFQGMSHFVVLCRCYVVDDGEKARNPPNPLRVKRTLQESLRHLQKDSPGCFASPRNRGRQGMMRKILLTLCLIGLTHSVLAQSAKPATSPPRSATPVRVSAVGEVQVMPDRAVVYFVLSAQGRNRVSARLVVQQLGQRMQDELAKLGVTKSQLKAERLDIAEVQRPAFSDTDDPERTEQFTASILYSLTMPVSERQLDNLLRIVKTISAYTSTQKEQETGSGRGGFWGGSGSTGVWVQFGVQNTEQLVEKATKNGVAQARRMAEAAAQQAGKRTVKLVRISVANASTGQLPASAAPYLMNLPITWNPVRVFVQVTADFEAQ